MKTEFILLKKITIQEKIIIKYFSNNVICNSDIIADYI